MIEHVIGPQLLAPLAQRITDYVFKFCKDCKDEVKQSLHDDIYTYIGNFVDKYSKIKTFLYSEERRNFYDVYFPLSLRCGNAKINMPENPDELFVENNFITLLGHAGCGKTMILRHLFLSACEKSSKLPLVIELRKLKSFKGDFNEYIFEQVFNFKLSQNHTIYERMLKAGKFLFLLDGYDEISIEQKDALTRNLEDFVDRYPNNCFLLTSRPGADAETFERFENYYVCALKSDQVSAFIDKQFANSKEDDLELANRIKSMLAESVGTPYMRYMKSPLLLSMFILTYNEHPELPRHISSFYYNVFDTLYSKHDAKSKAGGYQHEKKSKLSQDDIKCVLEAFCFLSYMQSTYEFSSEYLHKTLPGILSLLKFECKVDELIYDLSVAISIMVLDGTNYVFPHRSLQEYFAASYIANLREDAKKEIYTEKFINNARTERSTFWQLCEEQDQSCFIQYFLITSLELFIKELTKMNDKKIPLQANIFFNFMELTGAFVVKAENNRVISVRRGTFWGNFQRYIGIGNMIVRKLVEAVRNEGNKDFSSSIVSIGSGHSKQTKSKDLLDFYDRNGVFKAAEECVGSLRKLLAEKKDLLKSMQSDSIAMLDLI